MSVSYDSTRTLSPLSAAEAQRMAEILDPFAFDAVYGAFSGLGQIDANGKQVVAASVARYIAPHQCISCVAQQINEERIAMKRISILIVTIALLLASNAPASAEELALKMVGVWRVKSFEGIDVQSKEAYKPFGENPLSYYVFTKGGRYIKGNSSGTYKINGSKLTVTYDNSTNGGVPEITLEREIEVSGKMMTLKSMPVANMMTGKTIVFTVIAEKIE